MKTIRTIATVILAAFLVLGPLAAFGATSTMTLSTNDPTYTGQATIIITGTITPAPTIASSVVVTTSGPMGAVDIGTATVATGTGAFTYTLVSGGNAGWTSGTFTVNGTWGAQGNTASKTTTFIYTSSQGGSSGVTVTSTSTTTVTESVGTVTSTVTVTGTGTGTSSDAAQLTAIQTTLGQIQTTLSSISTAVTNLQTTLTNISSGLSTLGTVGTQITSMNTAVNNDQTYVLVVAALAAIVLVLELAILVRKLS